MENELAWRLNKFTKPGFDLVQVVIALGACRQRESDFVRMSQRNVVALGHVAVVVCCGQAKSHEVALHRVKAIGFCVDAYGACSGKFGLHLLKDFISVDADIGRRHINWEVCAFHFCFC